MDLLSLEEVSFGEVGPSETNGQRGGDGGFGMNFRFQFSHFSLRHFSLGDKVGLRIVGVLVG